MRDPRRIPIVMKKVEEVWSKHPDLRLGQLIIGVVSKIPYAKKRYMSSGIVEEIDPFYVEEDDFLQALEEWEDG